MWVLISKALDVEETHLRFARRPWIADEEGMDEMPSSLLNLWCVVSLSICLFFVFLLEIFSFFSPFANSFTVCFFGSLFLRVKDMFASKSKREWEEGGKLDGVEDLQWPLPAYRGFEKPLLGLVVPGTPWRKDRSTPGPNSDNLPKFYSPRIKNKIIQRGWHYDHLDPVWSSGITCPSILPCGLREKPLIRCSPTIEVWRSLPAPRSGGAWRRTSGGEGCTFEDYIWRGISPLLGWLMVNQWYISGHGIRNGQTYGVDTVFMHQLWIMFQGKRMDFHGLPYLCYISMLLCYYAIVPEAIDMMI